MKLNQADRVRAAIHRALHREEVLTGHRAILAWTGLTLGVLAMVAVSLPGLPPAVRLPFLLVFVCFGPGAAALSLVQLGDRVSTWATVLVLSIAFSGAVADLMIWTTWWDAIGGYALIAVPTIAIAVVALLPEWRSRWGVPVVDESNLGLPERLTATRRPNLVLPTWNGGQELGFGSQRGSVRGSDHDSDRNFDRNSDHDDPGTPSGRPSWALGGSASAGGNGGPALPGQRRPDDAEPLDWFDTPIVPQRVSTPDATIMLPMLIGRPDATISMPRSNELDATTIIPVLAPEGETSQFRFPWQYRADVSPPTQRMTVPTVEAKPFARLAIPAVRLGGITRGTIILEVVVVLAVLTAWIVAVTNTSAVNVGEFGLLSVVHPALYVAVGLCTLRFVMEIGRKQMRGWVLLTHTLLLTVVIHATVPLLVHFPEYSWTYRHIGVAEGLHTYGQVTDAYDIYQQWPTFFAFSAHLFDGSGFDPLVIASWAPVFFNLAYCLPLFALARTLTKHPKIPYLTVFIFVTINWVAQDYFAPQAFTFLLSLGCLLIMLRWLRRTTSGQGRTPSRIARLWAWAGHGLGDVPYASKNARRWATGVLYFLFAVTVASHQLSPYMVAMCAGALVALGLVRPMRIVPILLGICVLYLVPRYDVIDEYGVFDGFNFFSNAQTNAETGGASAGRLLSGQVVQLLALVVWGLAGLAVLASHRRLGPIAAPAVLAFAPFGLLLAQSYGGEAIYRVFLFSSPWSAFLIATLVLQRKWVPMRVAVPAAAILLAGAVVCNLQARHGHLGFNQFSSNEIDASRFVYTYAEPDAEVMVAASAFPNRFTASSGAYYTGRTGLRELLSGADDNPLSRLHLTEADLPTINSRFDLDRPMYLIFSPRMAKYLHYFGYAPDGLMGRLEETISTSEDWRIWYRNGDVTIYKYVWNAPLIGVTP